MKQRTMVGLFAFVLAAGSVAPLFAADGVIKIGISSSKSGSYTSVGAIAKNGVELAKQEINAQGLSIGDKTYTLEFIYVDNGSDRATASANTLELIGQHQVIAIAGPQSSDRAIPVGEVANAFRTPMVTTWATAPEVTLNKSFVFRMTVMYDVQATAMTKFAAKEWQAGKAAVLYDEIHSDPAGMAKAFKTAFENANGAGSVVAFEAFRADGTADFRKQLQTIIKSDADFLFLPQYHRDIPEIVNQARKMGWQKPITGSNTWSVIDLVEKCGDACKGSFITGNFAAGGAEGKAKAFTENYQKQYKMLPDEVAALNYDAIYLIAESLKKIDALTGNMVTDRLLLREQIARTNHFEGVAGMLAFPGTGDPAKCVILIKFDDNGVLTNYDKECPAN
jgi:ABC-type branched-chain amino acid transport systems, periplasmic component